MLVWDRVSYPVRSNEARLRAVRYLNYILEQK